MDNEKGMAERFGELAGRGAQAAVYARDEMAVKVFRAGYPKEYVFYEASMMAFVETTDLPVPQVHEVFSVEGRLAIRMSRARGRSINRLMQDDPARAPELLGAVVDLQRRTHAQRIPLPVRLKHKIVQLIGGSASLAPESQRALLERCAELPEGDALCHGDFHGDNILCHEGRYMILDWIDASIGCALGDACRTYLDYSFGRMDVADLYLEQYCAATGARREEILRWLPVQAGMLLGHVPDAFNARLLECIQSV